MRKALKTLPEGKDAVKETYNQALERIKSQNPDDKKLALRVLLWLTNSLRPLSLIELQYAVSFDLEEEIEEDCLISTELVLTACGGLVIPDSSNDAVRFVHYTTQEYFMQKRTSLFPYGHADLAISCVKFLCLDIFAFPPTIEGGCKYWPRRQTVPLQVYASTNWGQHARLFFTAYPYHRENREEDAIRAELEDTIGMFTASQDNIYYAFRIFLQWALNPQIFNPFQGVKKEIIFEDNKYLVLFNPGGNIHVYLLSMYAYFGLDHLLEYLISIDDSYRLESKDGFGNIVHWAVMGGHLSTLKVLLEKHNLHHLLHEGTYGGFIPSIETRQHQLPSAATLLKLERNCKGMINRYAITPLHLAVYSGKLDTTLFILGMMDTYNLPSSHRPNPLHDAISNEYVNITKAILESTIGPYLARHSYPIPSRTPHGAPRNSLEHAIEVGNCEIIELFLDSSRRDLFEQPEKAVRTALDFALDGSPRRKGDKIVKRLISHVVRAEALDEHVVAALHCAIPWASAEVMPFILRKLPDHDLLNKRFPEGDAPLHRAVSRSWVTEWPTMNYILENVVDINPRNSAGETPLHVAMPSGHRWHAQLLLEKGVDVNVRDNQGCTAFHYIMDPELVWALVKAGGNINERDFKGRTPLHHIVTRNYVGPVEELLKAGAQVGARDLEGATVLHLVGANPGRRRPIDDVDRIVKMLVDGGADINALNERGETPLTVARINGNVRIVELLAKFGAKEKSDLPLHTDVPKHREG